MAVQNVSFSAAVDAWAKKSQARMDAVFKESCQRVSNLAVDNAPIDTGFLKSSAVASEGAPTPMHADAKPNKGGTYGFDAGQMIAVIAGLRIGQTYFFCFTAAYSRRLEYGFTGTDSLGRSYNQPARGYVRLAVQQWQSIVAQVCREARARTGE